MPTRLFVKGQVANPNGRPVGARAKATLAAEALFDGASDKLINKVIEMAEKGDPTALKICIDRILPPRKDRPVSFKIPTIKTGQDVVAAIEAAVAAAAGGELTIPEANGVAQIVSAAGHAIELVEIEARIAKLEEQQQSGGS